MSSPTGGGSPRKSKGAPTTNKTPPLSLHDALPISMKRSIVLVAAAIVVVLLGGGVWHVIADRRAQQEELQRAAAQRVPAPLQFGADEVLLVQRHSLSLGVPVSGALRALNSAMGKARGGG